MDVQAGQLDPPHFPYYRLHVLYFPLYLYSTASPCNAGLF